MLFTATRPDVMAPGMYVIGNPDALPDTVHASVYAAISAIGLTLATADANASAVVIDIDATPDTLDADPLNVDAPVVRLAVAIGLTCALAETVLSAVVSAPETTAAVDALAVTVLWLCRWI